MLIGPVRRIQTQRWCQAIIVMMFHVTFCKRCLIVVVSRVLKSVSTQNHPFGTLL